eukprot:Em0085g11a
MARERFVRVAPVLKARKAASTATQEGKVSVLTLRLGLQHLRHRLHASSAQARRNLSPNPPQPLRSSLQFINSSPQPPAVAYHRPPPCRPRLRLIGIVYGIDPLPVAWASFDYGR